MGCLPMSDMLDGRYARLAMLSLAIGCSTLAFQLGRVTANNDCFRHLDHAGAVFLEEVMRLQEEFQASLQGEGTCELPL